MHLPRTFTDVPINIHKMAHNRPSNEKKKNPLLHLTELLEVAEILPAATFMFLLFILTLLKLDIRSKARFALSEAEAGVVGIDSTKDQRAEENQESVPSCLPL